MNPDKPFRIKGGKTSHVAIYNRILCLARVKHLSGVDLQHKSKWYRYSLDLEMYKRWYKNEPKDKVIDETFCQRMATVVKEMEKDAEVYDKATEVSGLLATAYKESKILPKEETKRELSWWDKLKGRKT